MVSCLCEFNPVISIDHFGCGDQEGEKDRLMNSDRISKEFQLDGKRKGSMLADYVFVTSSSQLQQKINKTQI